MRVIVEVAVFLAVAVLCGAAPPRHPIDIVTIRSRRNHIPNRFQVKGTIIKYGNANQNVQPAPFQRLPSILGIERNHIPNRFDIKGTPAGGAGAGHQSQAGQAYQPVPAAPDCCNPGGYSQYPGQYPSQVPGQYPSQVPGQYPSQVPGQYPSQVPGQYPSQVPGQYPVSGQYPSQVTPPECCNVGGMGQYPQALPPAGCCGAAPSGQAAGQAAGQAGASGALIVPLRGPKGEKTGFLRIGQNGGIKKLPLLSPPAPQAEAQGAAPSPYGASPAQGQGPAPYGAPPQPYGYQAQGSYPQPYGQQPYGAQGTPGQMGGYNPQNQGGFYPMDQQSDEGQQSDAQADAPPQDQPQDRPQDQPQFPQTEPFQEIQGQAFEAKKRTKIWGNPKRRISLVNN